VAVPVGSQLVVRATGKVSFDIAREGGLEDATDSTPDAPLPKGTEERRFLIKGDGSATLRGAGTNLAWTFIAIPDRSPTIALIKNPEQQARGAVRIDYKVDDDYGVVEAQAKFALKDDTGSEQPRNRYRWPWRRRRRRQSRSRQRLNRLPPSVPRVVHRRNPRNTLPPRRPPPMLRASLSALTPMPIGSPRCVMRW
jgi:hypothetical protein